MSEMVKKENAHIEQITPMTLIQAAQGQDVSIEKMEQLFELQMKWEQNEAKKAYNDAIAQFKSEHVQIKKDAAVDFTFNGKRTYYKHSSLAYVVDMVVPLLSKYGLSHSWETDQNADQIKVTCRVSHRQGHSESISLYAGADTGAGKNGIQAIGSTVTYLQRYTLFSILGLASGDIDDDAQSACSTPVEYISNEQVATIQSLLSELGKKEEDFLKWEGANGIETIPASRYDRAIKAINKLVKAK